MGKHPVKIGLQKSNPSCRFLNRVALIFIGQENKQAQPVGLCLLILLTDKTVRVRKRRRCRRSCQIV